MSDLISRALLAGLGLASLTKDAIQKTAEDLVDRSKMSEAEGRRLVKDLQKRSTQAQKALEKKIHTTVHQMLKGLNLAVIPTAAKASKSAKAGAKSAKKSRRRGAGKAAGH